jgi:hypothetical protein
MLLIFPWNHFKDGGDIARRTRGLAASAVPAIVSAWRGVVFVDHHEPAAVAASASSLPSSPGWWEMQHSWRPRAGSPMSDDAEHDRLEW